MKAVPRPEYPRPDFQRTSWQSLNGDWSFSFDDNDRGKVEHWYLHESFGSKIIVPFVYQSKASGINDTSYHPIQWYQQSCKISLSDPLIRKYLCFGAVDFYAEVWINGVYLGSHTGGYTPFSFDVTDFIHPDTENSFVVRSQDLYDCSQPRGKQYWKESNDRCWYTPSSGIWQSVWIEERPALHLEALHLQTDIDTSFVSISAMLNKIPRHDTSCVISIEKDGRLVQKSSFQVIDQCTDMQIHIKEDDYIDETHLWSPESPSLYDVTISLFSSEGTDTVQSYFGMRKIEIQNGQILLNNKPLYQRLILDQAYWENTLLTAPTDESFIKDIQLIKSMGFNGVRLHQKIEDPRFYYWTDKLGLLVWAEMPSTYSFNPIAQNNLLEELQAFIQRDRNHPSIICWVPLNESWGVRNIYANSEQQQFAVALYHLIKVLDNTRIIDTNDGWEQVTSDICGVHDYIQDGDGFSHIWKDLNILLDGTAQGKMIYANRFSYESQPILVTEFGGIAFSSDVGGLNWGYADSVEDESQFLRRLKSLIHAIRTKHEIQGFCYTQFTDVMQEVNGLLSIDREPKCSIEEIRNIIQH
ncbi:glycoside hydrolase family 2 protein [Sphaerochaeta halotolerans]|uniref:glycoside hydrolase family 2 protein n=1 Tax=Sphaerochaeta halotolerans TaxID=2293840 RepID=UPI0013679CCA|nr:glycoside hydrolase family 2 TIM barrel-domain containing protein [Sphaerochaeta halotolerans]MXI87605.1 glycoside hydrolase family 2 [Sphaerochaeta halotolerans]